MSMNHKTAFYAKFQAAVIEALPRDIDQNTALEWTKNSKALAHILRDTLTPCVIIKELSITCDGNKKFSDLIELGGYRWSHKYAEESWKYYWFRNDEYFPLTKHAPMERVVVLIGFRRSPTLEEVCSEFKRRRLKHPTYEDLGYFGIQHTKISEISSAVTFIPKTFGGRGEHGVGLTLGNINGYYTGECDRYKYITFCGEAINYTLGYSTFAAIRE